MIRWGPSRLPNPIIISPFTAEANAQSRGSNGTPTAGTSVTSARLVPVCLSDPFVVVKAFWLSGSTVGTDSFDVGVYRMTDQSTGRVDLIRSTGAVLSAGSVNVVQETATWRIAAANITTGVDSTDATDYTTASVTLKTGRLYLLTVVNTAADAAVLSSITGGATWTSRATTQYNTAAHRVSVWSCVPTADYTGTLAIAFGATQTGARWSLNEFSGVDTATNDGIVQTATGTGSSTTPLATLAAFGSADNATFGANANTSDSTTTPGTGFTELSDLATTTTPGSFLQTQWRVDNDTTSDGTITSNPWGAIAAELKADTTTPFIIPATRQGETPAIYIAFTSSGGTATTFRSLATAAIFRRAGMMELSSVLSLPSSAIAATNTIGAVPVFGFSRRSLIG